MNTIVNFKAYGRYVRNAYIKSSDAHKLNSDEKNEILSYSNISKEFSVRDWYGCYTDIKATLVCVKEDEYKNLIFTISINRDINKDYAPSPSDILKGKNLLYPVSYCMI